MPSRSSPSSRREPSMDRNQKAVARLLELAEWIMRRDDHDFSLATIRGAFPHYFAGEQQADRAWTRDKTELRRMGIRFREVAPGQYKFDPRASRARRMVLSEDEIRLLNGVAAKEHVVQFPPARHHVHVALRKLALAGVPLEGALGLLRPISWSNWRPARQWLSVLKGIWSRRRYVNVDYLESPTGRVRRHRVKVYAVFFEANLFVGDSDLTGRTAFYIPLVRRLEYSDDGSEAYEIPEDASAGWFSFEMEPDGLNANLSATSVKGSRPAIRQTQRSLAVGYMLLAALFSALPDSLTMDDALRLSGAKDPKELRGAIKVLRGATLQDMMEQSEGLQLVIRDGTIKLHLPPMEKFLLSLRPIEIAMLVALARTVPGHEAACRTLAQKLLRTLDEEERKTAESMARGFRLDSPVERRPAPAAS